MQKPIHRSKLRLLLGQLYYTVKKLIYWNLSNTDFGWQAKEKLPIQIIEHQTILRRKLQNIDNWMQENKIQNLKIAIQKIDGLVLLPGQTFSYWKQIGKPTKKKGYLEGMILNNGKVMSGIGGGLCQLSNLIYWITLHTPLQVTERWRHSYDVFPDIKRSQPFGSGATCSYPYIDLQIINPTNQKFQLSLSLTETHLVGQWLSDKPINFSYQIIEKDHQIKQEWIGAYSRNNKIYRKVIDKTTKKELFEEFITENQALMMYSPLLNNLNIVNNN